MILAFFRQAYPFVKDIPKIVRTNFLIGLFIALFLVIFQPFGTNLWEDEYKVLKLFGYGMVTFAMSTLLGVLLITFYPIEKLENNWTIGKELLMFVGVLLFISVGNLFYANLINIANFTISSFLGISTTVILLGMFPILASVMLKHNKYLALNSREAQEISEDLKGYQVKTLHEDHHQDWIKFLAENEKDEISLMADQLLYIESADNYCNIVSLEQGAQQKTLMRSSLKRVESQINYPYILRCHRSYIVNLNQVQSITGNAQGYRLHFKNENGSVAVARNYAAQILSVLKN